jgi:hypothetical protein
MSVLTSDMTAAMSDFVRWPIRDAAGSIVGHAASPETASYIESSMRAVEVRVINHA